MVDKQDYVDFVLMNDECIEMVVVDEGLGGAVINIELSEIPELIDFLTECLERFGEYP